MENLPRCSKVHSEFLLQGLNDLRLRGFLCDVKLHVGGICIPAHRAVLASCSPYFMAMFTSEMAEAQRADITIHSVESLAMWTLIDYAYTGTVDINQQNVQALLPAASLLQLKAVEDKCCSFLKSQLHPSNSIGIAGFAELHACHDLLKSSTHYTMSHFSEVAQHDEFLQLSSKEVSAMISSDKLTVSAEELVFNAIESWALNDFDFRKHSVPKLLDHLRLPQMPVEFLSNLLSNSMIQEVTSKIFLARARAAIEYKKNVSFRLDIDQIASSKLNTRVRPEPQLIYAVGGKNDLFATLNRVDAYCPEKGWWELKPLPRKTFECAAIACRGQLYVLGGILSKESEDVSGRCHDNSVLKLEPHTQTWIEMKAMTKGRSAMAVTVLKGCIYVLGGYDGENYLSSVEKYDPEMEEWCFVTAMSKSRSCFGAACVDDHMYAAGGYGPPCINRCVDNLQHLFTYMGERSVERFSCKDNRWEIAAPMFEKRINFAMSSVCGFLYAVGGHNGVAYLSSMERYDPHTNQWTRVSGMGVPRTGLGISIINGKLYAVGGHSGSSYLNTVQYYDPFADKWTNEHSMTTCRCSFGLAAI